MLTNIKRKSLNGINSVSIDIIKNILEGADKIVVGAGAGLSASAGLDYNDRDFFIKHYGPFANRYKTVSELLAYNWTLTPKTAKKYWAAWTYHLRAVYYQQGQLQTYKLLYNLINKKNYFIITTNADGQFFKALYDPEKIFAMQGNYGYFQCQQACHDKIYSNETYVKKMLEGLDDLALEIRQEDVPVCPVCGGLLCPNLRIDHNFVESNFTKMRQAYASFLSSENDSIVFLELGVGFNTPVIIRYPFEEMTASNKNSQLIRVNTHVPQVPDILGERGLSVNVDIHKVLKQLEEEVI